MEDDALLKDDDPSARLFSFAMAGVDRRGHGASLSILRLLDAAAAWHTLDLCAGRRCSLLAPQLDTLVQALCMLFVVMAGYALSCTLLRRADQEYQAPPFYQGELGYNPGFDADDPEKGGSLIGPDGEELPAGPRFAHKYKRERKINILGTLVRVAFSRVRPAVSRATMLFNALGTCRPPQAA